MPESQPEPKPEPESAHSLGPEHREAAAELWAVYARGLFPMADITPTQGDSGPAEIYWYDPDPRAMLPLTVERGLHIPKRLARTFRQHPYRITTDTDFNAVVAMCGDPARPCVAEEGGWIDEQIRVIAALLHMAGHAHSIEARDDSGRLVGGLYGVSVPGRTGPIFCAESMVADFDRGTDAGKLCLLHLLSHLERLGYAGCDVQMTNPHTEQFGLVEISRDEYHSMLDPEGVGGPCVWGPFDPAG